MRSYLDIVIDLKDGKKVDYEEARLGLLMANDLLFFAEHTIERLTGYGTEKEKKDLQSRLEIEAYESRFISRKLSPEEFLGSHHPDNPEQKKFMELSSKIVNKFLKDKEVPE